MGRGKGTSQTKFGNQWRLRRKTKATAGSMVVLLAEVCVRAPVTAAPSDL